MPAVAAGTPKIDEIKTDVAETSLPVYTKLHVFGEVITKLGARTSNLREGVSTVESCTAGLNSRMLEAQRLHAIQCDRVGNLETAVEYLKSGKPKAPKFVDESFRKLIVIRVRSSMSLEDRVAAMRAFTC